MIKKIGGVLLMLFGVAALFALVSEFSFAVLVIAVAFIYLGYRLIKSKPKTKSIPVVTKAPTINSNQGKQHYYFNVVGISKKNDKGQDIQKLIKEYVAEQIKMGHTEQYEDMSNAEILESGEQVYEADIYGDYEIKFEFEPINQYDPNAIKIIHEDIGHIGYVPKEETTKLKSILTGDYDLTWKLIGGKAKYIDEDEDKVKTKTLSYGITIDLYY